MHYVTRARRILHERILDSAKTINRCYSQPLAESEPPHEEVEKVEEKEEFIDPKWKKWWDGSFGNHPGKCRIPAVTLPKNFAESAGVWLSEFYKESHREMVLGVCGKLCDVLRARPLPIKPNDMSNKTSKSRKAAIRQELRDYYIEKDEEQKLKEGMENFKIKLWKQIIYDRLTCAAYLIGRAPGAYASTLRVLSEIKKRDPEFQPKSMLDYGSGTGTAVWAANSLWGKTLQDFFCVDWSVSMNDISQFILTGGREDAEMTGIFIRPMLPVSYKHNYDVVVAAYTLSELPSEKERLTTLKLLWEKTSKYLVIIEQGYHQGYTIIMEARNLICNGLVGAEHKKGRKTSSVIKTGHILAPCPHIKPCPRWKVSPCKFRQSYFPPHYAQKFLGREARNETFSYIILSKEPTDNLEWPRVMKDPLSHGNRITCHLCTASGKLQDISIRKETHDKDIRSIIKKAKAGDCLPFNPRNDDG